MMNSLHLTAHAAIRISQREIAEQDLDRADPTDRDRGRGRVFGPRKGFSGTRPTAETAAGSRQEVSRQTAGPGR